ncbi:MAG: YdcF family protein [Eubacteriales bacterium]
MKKLLKNPIFKVSFCLILSFLFLFGGLTLYISAKSQDMIQGTPEIMIILGCHLDQHGPSQSLRDRLDKALHYLESHPDTTIIVSGGQGSNEPTTEALGMATYLISHGIASEQIYQEGESHNTHQNLTFTTELMKQEGLTGDIIIVSSGFHLARASLLWNRVGLEESTLSTLAAPVTHTPSAIENFFREPLALVKSFLFDH